MNAKVAREAIKTFQKEQKRRLAKLSKLFDYDHGYYVWEETEEPFFNDLCLMLLVAVYHQVERELFALAAKVMSDGKTVLTYTEYEKRLKKANKANWPELTTQLSAGQVEDYGSMDVLRELANTYKHEPSHAPRRRLLHKLRLDTSRRYDVMPKSQCFRKGLADYLNLETHADFCEIAEEFVKRAERFVADVRRRQTNVATVKRRPASARPSSFLC